MSTTTETKSAESLLFSHYLCTGERLTGHAAEAFLETKACEDERSRVQKSADSVLFAHYLRTGERLYGEAAERFLELKFNQRHYRENGQFARAGEGALYGGGASASNGVASRSSPATRPKTGNSQSQDEIIVVGDRDKQFRDDFDATFNKPPRTQATQRRTPPATPQTPRSVARRNYAVIGELSAKHESWGKGDPGMVSTGVNDPGGVSYGKHQYSSTKGSAARFVASSEASRWASDFRGLRPGTPQFSAKWKQVAARDPLAFSQAQDEFTGRSHYDDKVQGVLRHTGLDLDRSGVAVQQAAFSVSVQHGGAQQILDDAVNRADKQSARSHSNYEATLINSIYDSRTEYVIRLRDRAKAEGRHGDAHTFDNIIRNRYPQERRDALRILATERR